MHRYICGDSEAKSRAKLSNLTCAVSGTKREMINATNLPTRHEDMEMPFILKAVLYIVLSIVAFLSFIGNTLEIIAFLRSKNLRTSTNYYITSMAFSDVIFVLSVWMLYSMSRFSVLENNVAPFVCRLNSYFWYLSCSVSVLSLVLISVDRFVATVFPMKISMMTGRIRAIFILLTWIFPMAFYIPVLYDVRPAKEAERPWICFWGELNALLLFAYSMVEVVLLYLLPLIIVAILNVWIVKSLRKRNPAIQENSHISITRNKRNHRVMKMLLVIIVFFFLSYTPRVTFAVAWNFHIKNVHVKMFTVEVAYIITAFILPVLSAFLNPVIIFSFSTNYRQALKSYLVAVCVKCQHCIKAEQSALEQTAELRTVNTNSKLALKVFREL